VESVTYAEPFTSGVAYVHYFPQGLVEQTVIQVIDESNANNQRIWSLVVHPLTGKIDIVTHEVSLREINSP
jgi:general secretion pathway protein H